jgi:simple sugar transport system ATP-binding protein
MEKFDIRAAAPEVRFSSLSGGNQQKAVLARELALPGLRLLVAAQPTRGLDVGAVESIYGHIRDAARRGVAVLLASSELDELLAVADRLLVMYRGRIMGECAAAPENRARIGAWMAGHAT